MTFQILCLLIPVNRRKILENSEALLDTKHKFNPLQPQMRYLDGEICFQNNYKNVPAFKYGNFIFFLMAL